MLFVQLRFASVPSLRASSARDQPMVFNGRALDRVTKQKHRPNRQKLSKKCPKIVFSAPLDKFWTFFRHLFDIFRTFCRHSQFLGCPTICPLQLWCFVRGPSAPGWTEASPQKLSQAKGHQVGRNRRGETRPRGPEVLAPLRGLGIRPLVSAIRGLGNPFPEAP